MAGKSKATRRKATSARELYKKTSRCKVAEEKRELARDAAIAEELAALRRQVQALQATLGQKGQASTAQAAEDTGAMVAAGMGQVNTAPGTAAGAAAGTAHGNVAAVGNLVSARVAAQVSTTSIMAVDGVAPGLRASNRRKRQDDVAGTEDTAEDQPPAMRGRVQLRAYRRGCRGAVAVGVVRVYIL